MAINLDEGKKVVMRIGLLWAILVAVIASAYFVGAAVNTIDKNDASQTVTLEIYDARLKELEKANGFLSTQNAVINNKLDNIQRDLAEVKASQKEQSRWIAAETRP